MNNIRIYFLLYIYTDFKLAHNIFSRLSTRTWQSLGLVGIPPAFRPPLPVIFSSCIRFERKSASYQSLANHYYNDINYAGNTVFLVFKNAPMNLTTFRSKNAQKSKISILYRDRPTHHPSNGSSTTSPEVRQPQ